MSDNTMGENEKNFTNEDDLENRVSDAEAEDTSVTDTAAEENDGQAVDLLAAESEDEDIDAVESETDGKDKDVNRAAAPTAGKEKVEDKASGKVSHKAPKKKLRIIIASAAAALAVAAAVYCIYVGTYDNIMPNTYIEDINLGGMAQEEARAVLADWYKVEKLDGQTINFSCMGDSSSILVNNLAIEFLPEKMASDAYNSGREKQGFFRKLGAFTSSMFSSKNIRPSLDYDEQALTGSIKDLCLPHEREPLGYTYRVGDSNNIIIAKPQDGVQVDMDDAVSRVEDEICTFRFGDVEFTPIVTKAPELDLDAFYGYITAPASDAYYEKDENGKVYVVPGKPQIVVNKSDIEAAVNQTAEEYSVPVQLVDSAVTAEYLQSVLYEDTLGTYTTSYGGSSAARSHNIAKASNTINGYELLPGEDFDFNKIVGERKASTGYLPAPVYVVKNGETVSEIDYGGGICQVSSTIFCAVSRADLKIISRTSHSKGVSYVPAGMDATVSWGGPEFIFRNDTDFPVRVLVNAGGGVLTARIVGSIAEKPDVRLDVQNDGNSVVVARTTTSADGTQTSEIIDSNTPPVYTAAADAATEATPAASFAATAVPGQ